MMQFVILAFFLYLRSQIPPTSSSSALPVTSPRRRFGGNGQNWGNLPLLKRTAVAAKRGGMAPWCPAAAVSHTTEGTNEKLAQAIFPGQPQFAVTTSGVRSPGAADTSGERS